MEDARYFTWANGKASHAVMLCEMERSSLTWFYADRIDSTPKSTVFHIGKIVQKQRK